MKKVLCFGELLLRFSPQMSGEWIHMNSIPVFIGGAELNVATALARWEVPNRYCTVMPFNALTHDIVDHLSGKGIGIEAIHYSGDRIGSYYLPQGADLKSAGVIYDRKHSAFWDLKPGVLNWDEILEGVNWFHFSAITPALHENLALVCSEALETAREKGITISVDLNYRSKLWQYGKDPKEVMPALVQYCNLVMGNIWAADKMLGIEMDALQNERDSHLTQAEKTSLAIMEKFPQCKAVANTFRFEHGEGVRYYASYFDGTGQFASEERITDHIVDRIGSGDCFMAGLIYGNIHNYSPQNIIDFATAAAFNKLFIKGDATNSPVEEIMKGVKNYA